MLFLIVCFKMKEMSAIYSAPGRAEAYLESESLQRIVPDRNLTDRCNSSRAVSFQPLHRSGWSGRDPL